MNTLHEKAAEISRQYHESLRTITVDDVSHIQTEDDWGDFVHQKAFVDNPDLFSHKEQCQDADDYVSRRLTDEASELIEERIG